MEYRYGCRKKHESTHKNFRVKGHKSTTFMTDGGKVLGAYYPKQLLFLKRLFVIKRQLDEHKVRQFIYAFFARVGFFYLLRTLCTTSFSNIHRAQDNIAH